MNRTIGLLLIGLLAGIGPGTSAGPFVPRKSVLPEELRCLAHIGKVSIHVEPLPPALADAITAGALADMAREMVVNANIGVADDEAPKTPRLVLHCMTIEDELTPQTMGIIFFLDVRQQVHVVRLDERMTLPTTTFVSRALAAPDQLGSIVRERCRIVTRKFVKYATELR